MNMPNAKHLLKSALLVLPLLSAACAQKSGGLTNEIDHLQLTNLALPPALVKPPPQEDFLGRAASDMACWQKTLQDSETKSSDSTTGLHEPASCLPEPSSD